MKKRFKIFAAVMAICLMATSLIGVGMTAKADSIESIDAVSIAGRECYVYVPESEWTGERSCTSPIFIVFGDQKYTADSVKQEAVDSGIAELAAAEGSAVVFVNPMADTWGDADKDLYAAVLGLFSDSSTENWVNGKAEIVDFMSGGASTKYAGTAQRIYVFGEGSGADFAAENCMKSLVSTMTFPDGFSMTTDNTPASVTLMNLSKVPEVAFEGSEVPAAIINGPEGIEDALKTLNPTNNVYTVTTSDTTDGWDAEKVKEVYESTSGTVRRQVGVIHKIVDYAAVGIKESVKTKDIKAGTVKYYEYIPESVDMSKKGTVPLLMLFHGGGNTAEYIAWASEWPLVAKENGFIVVAVQDHPNYTSDDMVELLGLLKEEYPAIDSSRVYASGFSMGSVKSWNIAIKHADVFAGVIPCDAGYMAEGDDKDLASVDINYDLIMPTFYVAGSVSPLSELPHQLGGTCDGSYNNVDEILEVILKMNGVTDSYEYNAEADQYWGIAPTSSETLKNEDYADSELIMNSYASTEDEVVYTMLCTATNKSHETYANEAWEAWEFISQFSRNEDGTLTIASQQSAVNPVVVVVIVVVVIVVIAAVVVVVAKKRAKKN